MIAPWYVMAYTRLDPCELEPVGTIGLGESLTANRVAFPDEVKAAMQDHERKQGSKTSRSGFRAWRVNEAVVTVQKDWN